MANKMQISAERKVLRLAPDQPSDRILVVDDHMSSFYKPFKPLIPAFKASAIKFLTTPPLSRDSYGRSRGFNLRAGAAAIARPYAPYHFIFFTIVVILHSGTEQNLF